MSDNKNTPAVGTLWKRTVTRFENQKWFVIGGLFVVAATAVFTLKSLIFPNNVTPSPGANINSDNRITNITHVTQETAPPVSSQKPSETLPREDDIPKAYTVSGHVYDNEGKPLDQVQMQVSGLMEKVVTNEDGSFAFNFKAPPAYNSYSITFNKAGYESFTLTYYEIPKQNISVSLKRV